MKKLIGFYDYTVILTYLGLTCAVLGMIQAFRGLDEIALLLLGGALFCDTTDGMVARSKKGRTDVEKQFGVQIDSLCDVISFGVFPALMFYFQGMETAVDICLLVFYCLCCVVRLAFFNVLAQEPQKSGPASYHGLPVVGMAIFVPMAFMMEHWVSDVAFLVILRCMLLVFGTLYVLDFKIKKPKVWQISLIGLFFWIPMAVIFFRR